MTRSHTCELEAGPPVARSRLRPRDANGLGGFTVRESVASGERTPLVLPDVATCPECLREVFDPGDRRHRYPFTNCTNCGPRYTIVLDLPYERAGTTMMHFAMCARCRAEYEDPADRRFHAEPNACPACGPHLELWDAKGRVLATHDAALLVAAAALRSGHVLALKGLGGFHLMVDGRSEHAVNELRRRKRSPAKPFAVMVPTLGDARAHGELHPLEEALLASPAAPVVLARRRRHEIAAAVAPGNPNLGLLLPHTPLHHLLLAELCFPVVATGGNASDEPICTDEREAVDRLHGIADLFLVHDRPIAHPVDDSVARVVAGREMLLRRARGYVPLPVASASSPRPILAVGAHLENTVASGGRVITVQHHHAHVLAGMADNDLEPPVLGIAWDGWGYGPDGTVWGGEALRVRAVGFDRVGWLRTFPLPGGEKAVRQPRRTAVGALYALLGDRLFEDEAEPALALFSRAERKPLRSMLQQRRNCPLTSSAGRLFDAVAALAGLHPVVSFEGQAAAALESALDGIEGDAAYPFEVLQADGAFVLDWGPMLQEVRRDVRGCVGVGQIALRFHNALAEMIVAAAVRSGQRRVVLTGDCFQNAYLSERAIHRLREEGFAPYWHRRIPPNDGGIVVGQALAAGFMLGEAPAPGASAPPFA